MVLEASNFGAKPFHGWLIQSDRSECPDPLPTGPGPNCDGKQDGFWARILAQSTSNFVPNEGHTVAFDDD